MMMLHRSASESAFSKTHRTHAPASLSRQDSNNTDDGGVTLASTPSIRTLPGRPSFTTPSRRGGSLRTQEQSVSTPSSSTSRLAGSQQLRKPASGSFAELQRHRALGKAISQQTVLSGSSTTAFSKTAWASQNSVDTGDGRRGSRKSSRSSSRRHLVLPPPSGDEDEDDGYEPIFFSAKGSPCSVKPSDHNTRYSFNETPSSPHHKNRGNNEVRSPEAAPGSPHKQNNHSHYHPHNEKFPIPNSPNTPKSRSVKSPDYFRDDVFDFSHSPKTTSASKHAPAPRDSQSPFLKHTTPVQGRGRKPSREVLLEFPSDSNTNARSHGRVAQQTHRLKEERRERVQNSNTPGRQGIRSAQSVPRLDGELAVTTPTNSPDRSTRPRSVVDARERPRQKSNRNSKMCDFFFFFRWGKKKDKRSHSDQDEPSDEHSRSRSRGKSGRFFSKSGDSTSPSGSKDKHNRQRSRSRSKNKTQASSRDRSHRSSRHPDREDHNHSHSHRPSSSTSRPLRTPTSSGQTPDQQYRQYRHHHRREQQHKKNHHSPDENRPPPQQYTPSRQKRERPKKEQHRRGRRGKGSGDDAKSHLSDGTVGLRHEDLPLHPSISKALAPAAQKTLQKDKVAPVSGSYLKNTFVRAPGTGGIDQMRRGWKRSRSESPSNLRPSTGHSGSTTNIAGESSNGGGDGGEVGELRDRSMHSASRTDLDSNFHYTESITDHRRHSGPKSPGMNRSRSYPGFESSRNATHYYNPDADTKVINDAEDFEYKPTDMNGPLHLSFCGCGFVGMYHLGVVSCLLARGESFLERVDKVAGSSAGALMAAVMLCAPDRLEDLGEQLQALARELRSRPLGALTPGYSFARALRLLLDDLLPEDAHLLVSGKLHISLTAAAGQGGGDKGKKKSASNELMTEFNTRDELVEALVATSYIPLYAGLKMPVIRGKKYMDGCFSDNMPSFPNGRTITVSPFDGRSDIAPKEGQEAQKKAHFISVLNQEYQVNVRNMKKGAHVFFPPKRHVMQEYFDLGRYDASRFLIREGLYTIKLIHCAEKAVYVSSV